MSGGPDPLREVLRHANRVYTLVQQLGREDLAERIRVQAARWAADHTAVVLAGEVKRGKSSLINVLLDRPGLLPVDEDVATSVQLLVRHAEEPSAVVTRLGEDGSVERVEVGFDEIADHASMGGPEKLRIGVTGVEIGIPHGLLERGIVLVDTPGVGSMTRGHRDVTMAALSMAHALVFTVSADAPITRSELDFLAAATERVDAVVPVLTKIDGYADWEEIRSENRQRTLTYAERLGRDDADAGARLAGLLDVAVLPVSAHLAARGRERAADGHAAAGARLLARSGIEQVRAGLEAVAASREQLRARAALRLSLAVLAVVESEQCDRIGGADQDPELDARLAAEQADLKRLGSQHARWRQRFALELTRVQAEATRILNRELASIETRYRDLLRTPPGGSADLAEDLHRSLVAAWSTVATVLTGSLEQAVSVVSADLGIAELRVPLEDLVPPAALRELDLRDPVRTGPRVDWVDDGIPAAMAASAFGSITAVALGPAGWVVGGLVAAGIGLARHRRREEQRSRGEHLAQLREALTAARTECVAELASRLVGLRLHLESGIEQRLADLDAELDQRRVALRELLQDSAARRKQAKAAAQESLTAIRALRTAGEALHERVRPS